MRLLQSKVAYALISMVSNFRSLIVAAPWPSASPCRKTSLAVARKRTHGLGTHKFMQLRDACWQALPLCKHVPKIRGGQREFVGGHARQARNAQAGPRGGQNRQAK